jgi:outer membrane protein assembly factor BamB
VDAQSGDFAWGRDLPATDGTTVPLWYAGQCPLIDGNTNAVVVLAPCGPQASLIGVDLASGDVLWSAPNPGGWKMSHGSVAIMEVEGVRMYVYAALGGVLGVKADEPGRGALLWTSDAWKPSVQSPTPLPLADGGVLLTAGYGAGGMLLQVAQDAASTTGWAVRVVRPLDRRDFGSEQQTPILRDGIVYGVMPADGGAARRELVAMRPDGTRLWASGADDRFGLGPYLLVDGRRMLLLADDGVLTMADVGVGGYRRLARAKLLHSRDAWGPMAFVDGRLLLRDDRTLICVDLRKP